MICKEDNIRKLKMSNILSYSVGDIYGGGAFFIIGALFLVFLTDVAGLSPTLAGVIIMVGKIWDAVTDPTMGYISDNTRSKYGRRRIYFLIGIIPIFISFSLLWMTLGITSQWSKFLYYLLIYVLFNTVFTMVMVPYNAMPAEMTSDYKERSKLIGIRMSFSQFGMLLGAILPLTIINQFDLKSTGYMIMGVVFGILYAIPWYFVFRGTTEKAHDVVTKKNNGLSKELKKIIKEFFSTFKNKSLRVHISMYLCAYVAMDVFNALLIYYLRDYLGKDNYYQVILGTVVIVQMLSLLLVTKLCGKFGNAKTYRIHSTVWIIAIIGMAIINSSVPLWVLILIGMITGVGLSGCVMIPYNMLAFVIDVDELISKRRREGTYSGMMTFVRKIAQALAIFFVGLGLELVGYQSNTIGSVERIIQSQGTILGIRIMFLVIPITLIIMGIISSFKFKISPKNHKVLIDEIQRLKDGGSKNDIERESKKILESMTGQLYDDLWN